MFSLILSAALATTPATDPAVTAQAALALAAASRPAQVTLVSGLSQSTLTACPCGCVAGGDCSCTDCPDPRYARVTRVGETTVRVPVLEVGLGADKADVLYAVVRTPGKDYRTTTATRLVAGGKGVSALAFYRWFYDSTANSIVARIVTNREAVVAVALEAEVIAPQRGDYDRLLATLKPGDTFCVCVGAEPPVGTAGVRWDGYPNANGRKVITGRIAADGKPYEVATPTASTVIPVGQHAHVTVDGRTLIHSDANYGSAAAHASVQPPWVKIATAGQTVPTGGCPGGNCPASVRSRR